MVLLVVLSIIYYPLRNKYLVEGAQLSVFGETEKWMRAGKAVEQLAGGPWESAAYPAERLLFEAVVDGEVQAKFNNAPLADMTLITKQKWHETEKYALPFDLMVNCEDVDRKWNWLNYELADLIAFDRVSAGKATSMLETAILNLRVLLKRFHMRAKTLGPEIARSELDFNTRWANHLRECKLLLSVPGQEVEALEALAGELDGLKPIGKAVLELRSNVAQGPKKGRKEKYDWNKVESHIRELFLENGALSADDKAWQSQADVERAIIEFCQNEFGEEPAISTARKKAKLMISKYDGGRALSPN
jgi:hypothetical protein